MPITDWPDSEKPRDRLLNHGCQSLSEAELLAIFLRTGTKGQSAVDLGRNLLKDFGSLRNLLNANSQKLLAIPGLGPAKCAQLLATLELANRYVGDQLRCHTILNNPKVTEHYLLTRLSTYQEEVFACLFLDTHNRLLQYEELFQGTVNAARVYPRVIAKRALDYNATAVIFAHNHPSGDPEPSDADIRLTKQLKTTLDLFDIKVLDHIVVGAGKTVSLSERGLI